MNDLRATITGIEKRSMISALEGDDWYIAADGLIHCKKCGKPRQFRIPEKYEVMGGHIVGVVCDCQLRVTHEAIERQKALEEERRMNVIKQNAFRFNSLREMTFQKDVRPDSELTRTVKHWTLRFEAGKNKKWLFMHGVHRSGKTYYAACIANYLLSRGYDVRMCSAGDIDADFWSANDRKALYDKYAGYDLLVLDDFDFVLSDHLAGVIYKIISDRDIAGKFIVFTSAMTNQQIANSVRGTAEKLREKVLARSYPLEFSETRKEVD